MISNVVGPELLLVIKIIFSLSHRSTEP